MTFSRHIVFPILAVALASVTCAAYAASGNSVSQSMPQMRPQLQTTTPFSLAGTHRFSLEDARPDADDLAATRTAPVQTAQTVIIGP